jgi:O-antigen/teichoic acid export membrane protein
MRRKFLTNLALLLFLNLLVKPFWIFGIDRTVQNIVGDIDFGFYFTIFNFAFLFNILLDLGITSFNNRNIAQNQQLLNKHFSSILILKLLLLVSYTSVTFLVAWIIGYNAEQFYILGWIAFNNFLLSFITYLRSNVSGLLLLRTDSILSVLDRVLMIAICAVLIWGNVTRGPFRIEWFVYAQTAAYMGTALIALFVVIRKASFRKLNWNWPFFLMILKQSFPFAVMVLLMSVYNKVDSVFIERLLPGELGYQQSGIFAKAYRLLDAANQLALLFGVLLLPIYSRMIKHKQSLDQMVRLPFDILISVAVIASVSSYFFRFEIMHLLYPQRPDELLAAYDIRIEQSGKIFGLIMFGFIGTSLMYVFSTLLTANRNLKQLNLTAATGILINFTLNLILVPKLQAYGSAIANFTTLIVTGLTYAALVQYFFRFRINKQYLLRLFTYFAVVTAMGFISVRLPLGWISQLIALVLVSLAFAFILKLLNLKGFYEILKSPDEQS